MTPKIIVSHLYLSHHISHCECLDQHYVMITDSVTIYHPIISIMIFISKLSWALHQNYHSKGKHSSVSQCLASMNFQQWEINKKSIRGSIIREGSDMGKTTSRIYRLGECHLEVLLIGVQPLQESVSQEQISSRLRLEQAT